MNANLLLSAFLIVFSVHANAADTAAFDSSVRNPVVKPFQKPKSTKPVLHLFSVEESSGSPAERKVIMAMNRDAITITKGNGSFRFAMFSDPDCQACQDFEKTLENEGLSDYTRHVFLLPSEASDTGSAQKSESVWCLGDKASAWEDLMTRSLIPPAANCQNPIERNTSLAKTVGIRQVPAFFLGNGDRVEMQEMIRLLRLRNGSSEAQQQQ